MTSHKQTPIVNGHHYKVLKMSACGKFDCNDIDIDCDDDNNDNW